MLYLTTIKKLKHMNNKFVKTVLKNNGYDLEEVFDEGIESGTEDWMSVVEEVTGEDPYDNLSDEGLVKISEFISIMEDIGIDLY